MKTLLLSLISFSIFTLCAQEKFIRPVMEMYPVKNFSPATGLKNPAWSKAKAYPFMLNAAFPQDFGVLPPEESKVQIMYDKDNFYIRTVMSDSEVLCEAVDQNSPIPNCSDYFCIVLRPKSETGFFYILGTPNAITKAVYVTGPGAIRLASANLPLETKIPVFTSINGKLNDGKRDKSWSALTVLPVKKLISEVRKHGVNINESCGWTLMTGRRNYSRFLEIAEISGYPQPVRGFFNMRHHARLCKK